MAVAVEAPPKLQPNPYREALVQARHRIVRLRPQVADSVARPRRTLANAWQCPAANALDTALHLRHRGVLTALDGAIALLDARIRAEPELIVEGDSRFQWRTHPRYAPTDSRRGY